MRGLRFLGEMKISEVVMCRHLKRGWKSLGALLAMKYVVTKRLCSGKIMKDRIQVLDVIRARFENLLNNEA